MEVLPTDGTNVATTPRLPSLTGLRFVAAAMVLCFHVSYEGLFASAHTQDTYSRIVGQAGFSGVSFFFILSGFVLTVSARRRGLLGFLRRRACKIYPNHLVIFVAAVLLILAAGKAVQTGPAVAQAFLVQAWVPRPEYLLNVNNVSWSLCCEVLFYLAFPLLYRLVGRVQASWLWPSAIAVTAGAFALPLIAAAVLPGTPAWGNASGGLYRFWFVYMFPPARLLDFVLGILLARILIEGRRIPLRLGGAVALAVAAYALAPLFSGSFFLVAVTLLPLGLLILAAAAEDADGRPTWMSKRVMVRLGELSFAFYLWHWLVLSYGHQFIGQGQALNTPLAFALVALLAAITLSLSWLTFTFVESPVMRRFASPRRAVEVPLVRLPRQRGHDDPARTDTGADIGATAPARVNEEPTRT
jgi:mycarose O-acyltransferase